MEERVICEAGVVWKRVLRRFEARVNELLGDGTGWKLKPTVIRNEYAIVNEGGFIRRRYIAVLERPTGTNIVKP